MKRYTSAVVIVIALILSHSAYAGESGVAPNVISLPDGPGSVMGLGDEFVTQANTGTATYGISVEVPEGSGGFKPAIPLAYDGGKGNSALGFGWSLSLPRIQLRTDEGLPRYDGDDAYFYSDAGANEELVPLAGGSYRLATEGAFIRATKDGAGWEVRTKSGIIYTLGDAPSSRIMNASSSKTFAWNVSAMEDANGNRIDFEWSKDEGQSYLTRVAYNDYGSDVVCEVSFTYEARADALTNYRSTFPVTTAQRLKRIDVRRGGKLVRSYALSYDAATTLSRIAGIAMTGSDGTTAMPPLAFEYTQFAPAAQPVAEMLNPPGQGIAEAANALVDLNGDSLPDLLVTDMSEHRYYINEDGISWTDSSAMNASPSYELGQTGVRLADLNGDGVSDLVVAKGVSGNSFYPGSGDAGWDASVPFDQNPVGFQLENDDTRFMDLNGDRLIDVLHTNPASVSAWIHLGNGAFERFGNLPEIDDQASVMLSDSQVKLADFNGDGLVDVGRLRSQSLVYWPSMGFGLFDDPIAMSGVPQMAEEERHHVADLNGDGLADIVYVGVSNVGYWLNRGDGSFADMETIAGTPFVDPVQGEVQFADMNGNGTTDIVWVDLSGGPVGAWQYLDPIGDQFAGLITRVDNGLGKVVTIEYESSTAHMIRAMEMGSPWLDTLPFPIPVIKRVVVGDSIGSQMVSEYDYRDGYFVAAEEEFRGFGGATKTDVGDASIPTLVTRWTYDVGKSAEALKGRMLSEEFYDEGGYVFSRSENSWTATTLANGENGLDVVFPHLDVTVGSVVEGAASPRFTRQDMFYDAFGNLTDELSHGEVASIDDNGATPMGDDEVFVHREFAINESAWILDRVSSERVRDGEGNRVSESRYYYDGAVFNGLPLGQVERGNLMREERWLDAEDRFVPVARNRVDEWGNVTAMLDANGGRREIFYDALSHTYPVRERVFIGNGAIDYVVDYDDVFGKISSLKDPNDAQTAYFYDALGRLAYVVKPGDSPSFPTASYSYELASPISTVTVRARETSGQAGTQDSYIYYDGLGRVRAKVSEASGGDFAVTEAAAYNARGEKSFLAQPFMCGESCTFYGSALLDNSGTSMIYDAMARVAKTVHPDGSVSLAQFRPFEELLFDENDTLEASRHYDTPTTKRYDGQGRLVSTTFANGGEGVTTAFVYDAAGKLTTIVDSDGNTRTQSYDSLGRMVAIADPNAGQRSYAYDDVGNMTEKVKPTGERIRFLYEATSNRVLAKNLVTSQDDDSWEVVYHYDAPSSAWEGHGRYLVGKLAWVEDGVGVEYYAYDARGRMVAKRRDVGSQSFALSFEHDAMDRRTNITYPDGSVLPISYDERGLLRTVGDYLLDRTYNAAGQVLAEALGDGISRSYSYDARQRLTDLSTVSVDGDILQQFHYDFDAASNITAIDDLRSVSEPSLSQKQSFAYDDLYRLTDVALNDGSITWSYDDVGNIVGKATTLEDQRFHAPEIRYGENGAGPYAVTTHGDDVFGYDGNGNLMTMPGQTLAYDAEDRLTSVAKDDGTVVEMVYGFDGQRRIKRVRGADGDVVETLYVDPVYEVRGDTHYKYIWADGKRIARAKVTTE